VDSDSQQQQRNSHHATDGVRHAPIEQIPDQHRDHCAADPHRRHQRRRVTTRLPRHDFADERDAGAQLPCETDAGEQPQHGVRRDIVDERVQDVRDRIHDDRPEQHRETASPVAEHAPGDPAQQHPCHLHVEQQQAFREQLIRGHANGRQALHADDAEQNEVVDVDEIAERGDQDRETNGAQGKGGRRSRGLHSAAFYRRLYRRVRDARIGRITAPGLRTWGGSHEPRSMRVDPPQGIMRRWKRDNSDDRIFRSHA
jgi:hypothetical protein